ncbi:DUF2079 domain-containing protein [Nocardioidaceae bacterium]|nr:DUF2079 domain-containing protein [Nocardioidaceae bacterium]
MSGAARRWAYALLGLLAAVAGTAYAAVPLLRWRQVLTPSWDNAIFSQALISYASGELPTATIKGPGFALLGDHFSPAVAVLTPLWWAWPDGRVLLLAQAVLLAFSMVVIGRAAVQRLGAVPGLAMSVAYAGSFAIAAAVAVDFHEVTLAVPLLALAGAAWLRDDIRAVIGWSLPLLLVKEDLGATVAAVGLVLLLDRRRRHPRAGTALLVGGLVAAALTVLVVVPALGQGGYDYLAGFEGSASTTSGAVGLDGLTAGWGTKLTTLLVTLGSVAFLALLSPWALLLLPTLAWRFAGDNATYWGTDWHYSLVLAPVLAVAAVDALERLRGRGRPRGPAAAAARVAPLAAVGATLGLAWGGPYATLLDPGSYATTARTADARTVQATLPRGSVVESDIGLITRLVADHRTWWVGTAPAGLDPDYVVVDQVYGGWSGPVDPVAFAEEKHAGTAYDLLLRAGDFAVARRVSSPDAPGADARSTAASPRGAR